MHGGLFGVVEDTGKFYERNPPQNASDNWLGTANLIGGGGWASFRHLFFDPNGTLYGVLNDKFYKAPPPISPMNWIAEAEMIGDAGWNAFQFLFFDPEGILYGVIDGKLYRRLPLTQPSGTLLESARLVGSEGWDVFQFLFFDPEGMLYGVEHGRFHKRLPPNPLSDLESESSSEWLESSTLIGSGGWGNFQFLFFMSDGDLYGVHDGKFYKRSPPTQIPDNWLGSSTLIGSGGWHVFKFLMAPLTPQE